MNELRPRQKDKVGGSTSFVGAQREKYWLNERAHAKNPLAISIIPVLSHREKDKVVENMNKVRVAAKKKMLWIPPGV